MSISEILNLISTSAVVIGVVYGLIQLNHFQSSRKRENALLVLNSFQSPGFIRGLVALAEVPDGLSMKELRDLVGEDIEAILILANTFERIGWLVYHREIPIELVEDALTGPVLVSWKKLDSAVADMRGVEGRDGKALEWFQWLAERVGERMSAHPAVPAYIAHAEWKA
jgi:hypothetical protein